MEIPTIAASRREQLLDLADSISRDAENIEARVDPRNGSGAAAEGVLALVYELRAHRLTIAAAIAPTEPPREPEQAVKEGWWEVELMGHRQRWAYVRTVAFAGRTLVEIREPAHPKQGPQHTGDSDPEMQPERVEYYSPSAIFSLTPSTEHAILQELQERSYQPF